MQLHSSPRRHATLLLLLLLSALTALSALPAVTATTGTPTSNTNGSVASYNHNSTTNSIDDSDSIDSSDDEPPSCYTRGDCCQLCGIDSVRCARGPCSDTFMTKKLFSLSLPTMDVTFWDITFSFYGMVPYLVFAAITLELVARRSLTWTRVFAFWLIPIVSVLTSSILVKSLGSCTECARPCGSCIKSTGMPSGHATNAAAYCVWVILECLRGVGHRWPLRTKVLVIAAALLVFAPVAYGRVYLGGHTELQVAIGTANGVVLGFLYFALLHYVVAKRLDRASQWLARGRCPVRVVNDYYEKPPRASAFASREIEPAQAVTLEQAYACGPLTPPVVHAV